MNIDGIESLEPLLKEKLDECRKSLGALGRVVVAFSGGVDSTFLLALAEKTLGKENVLAAMAVSPTYPRRERQAARKTAAGLGVDLVEVKTQETSDPRFAANPSDRCFYCKSELFARLKAIADEQGFAVVTGDNADDTGDFRPGLRAGDEMNVRRPLLEAGLTKDDIRRASSAMGLETWDKPSMACLASRIPYGSEITRERLARIEQAEDVLHDLGFRQCRVRDHGKLARIEVPVEELEKALAASGKIVPALKRLGYVYVTLDLQGFRSGSMNEPLDPAGQDDGSAGGQ